MRRALITGLCALSSGACLAQTYPSKPIRLVIPDTGPLISLAVGDALDLLLLAREDVRIVLTDMVGGTPSNIATRLLSDARVAGIAGANLPMLVRLLTYRNEGLARAVHKALLGGSEGVALLAQEVGNAASRG